MCIYIYICTHTHTPRLPIPTHDPSELKPTFRFSEGSGTRNL